MRRQISFGISVLALSALFLFVSAADLIAQSGSLGIFEGQSDVGSVTPPGTLTYSPTSHIYSVTAAGANLWSTTDGFHFVWKKVSGDVALTAEMNIEQLQSLKQKKKRVDAMSKPEARQGKRGVEKRSQ